ncbi:helix-turn-helix domain-containing protein [Aquimarina algiphila]|uniref:Helix-turn-helix domain-containing protein n=1 Tax=Aquimarina algiphila TaxID=2047982 RepID=A0A554VBT4_9FLAO|nr:helix-turn-helix domain-containing protein [Aquimarina algiphila]TSE04051.1 helix-turn-helix domain-containing protein [Aquimarina algiphila]
MKGKFIVFETKAFYKLVEEVIQRVKKTEKPIKNQQTSDWVNAIEAKQLLGIKSTGKLRKLLYENHIVASQHGRTILYSRKSILAFLEQHKI